MAISDHSTPPGGATALPDLGIAFRISPTPMLIVRSDDPKYSIVDANDAYLRLGGISLASAAERGMFEVFPISPEDSKSTGPSNLLSSFRTVVSSCKSDLIRAIRYDADTDGTGFRERFWRAENVPIPASDGTVQFILHCVQPLPADVGAELGQQWHLFDSVLSISRTSRTRSIWRDASPT
jgi:hypothetical protein